nr:hypothetical protein [Tanacetum cinerariifolium]
MRPMLMLTNCRSSQAESLNDNPIPDCVLNSSVSIPISEESDNFLSDNFLPEFETFCDHTEETRSCNTTHADNSLPEYDSFCFEIEPDQERFINVLKNDISVEPTNDPLLEESDLFLFDNSIPPGIKNFGDDSEGDILPRPPPEPPDAETDVGDEISVVMNYELECLKPKDKLDDDDYFSFMTAKVFSFHSAES